jgi:zinc transport system permease protein
MAVASGLGMVFCSVGLALSYSFNLSSGATIILVASIVYLISLAFRR